jgi:hypothetical protein
MQGGRKTGRTRQTDAMHTMTKRHRVVPGKTVGQQVTQVVLFR